jgi:hypothetical protein
VALRELRSSATLGRIHTYRSNLFPSRSNPVVTRPSALWLFLHQLPLAKHRIIVVPVSHGLRSDDESLC